MQKFNIKNQITKLYMVTAIGYFQIAGASWVALLALRGFSLFEIGLMESIFHVVSFIFEIPSGVVADVFGRKKTLALSRFVSLMSKIFMIVSTNFWTTAFAIDAVIGVVALFITFTLKEVCVDEKPEATRVTIRIRKVVRESARFLVTNKRARAIMIVMSGFMGWIMG